MKFKMKYYIRLIGKPRQGGWVAPAASIRVWFSLTFTEMKEKNYPIRNWCESVCRGGHIQEKERQKRSTPTVASVASIMKQFEGAVVISLMPSSDSLGLFPQEIQSSDDVSQQ